MSNKSANVIIPREHQSAPKETWADKEVAKAAEEIRTGQFTPVLDDDDLSLAVGLKRGLIPEILTPGMNLNETLDSLALSQHPRVKEAMARLEQEKNEAKNTQEALEKTQMLFELNRRATAKNKWDGQERWEEDEEARIGLILTPFAFLEKLEKVIGEGRVFLNRFAVYKRVALLAPDNAEKSLIVIPGQEKRDDGLVQVGTLQYPCGTEWMVMRFDEYGVPTQPKYLGWRTALLSMIQLGVISEKEAHKAFPLGTGPVAAWYREQLFIYRNQKGVLN